jgi:hypothetical protein
MMIKITLVYRRESACMSGILGAFETLCGHRQTGSANTVGPTRIGGGRDLYATDPALESIMRRGGMSAPARHVCELHVSSRNSWGIAPPINRVVSSVRRKVS